VSLSQVIFLFCAYLGLASIKHDKSKLSLFKFFPYFPDVAQEDDGPRRMMTRIDYNLNIANGLTLYLIRIIDLFVVTMSDHIWRPTHNPPPKMSTSMLASETHAISCIGVIDHNRTMIRQSLCRISRICLGHHNHRMDRRSGFFCHVNGGGRHVLRKCDICPLFV
jgi:hypothetical protein